jgi:hypothetical protein
MTSINQLSANTLKNSAGSDSMVVIGRPQPNQTIDFGAVIRIGNLTINNVFEGARGFVQSNETLHLRMALRSNQLMADVQKAVADPSTDPALKQSLVNEYGLKHNGIISNTIFDGDYLRWAEITASYRLPEAWSSVFSSSSTTVSLGVKNVKVFSDYFNDFKLGTIDPGTRGLEANNAFLQNVDYLKTPAPRRIVLSIRTQF